jgi:hypothetical protein
MVLSSIWSHAHLCKLHIHVCTYVRINKETNTLTTPLRDIAIMPARLHHPRALVWKRTRINKRTNTGYAGHGEKAVSLCYKRTYPQTSTHTHTHKRTYAGRTRHCNEAAPPSCPGSCPHAWARSADPWSCEEPFKIREVSTPRTICTVSNDLHYRCYSAL